MLQNVTQCLNKYLRIQLIFARPSILTYWKQELSFAQIEIGKHGFYCFVEKNMNILSTILSSFAFVLIVRFSMLTVCNGLPITGKLFQYYVYELLRFLCTKHECKIIRITFNLRQERITHIH